MVATASTTPATFVSRFARSGFRFDTFVARDVARETAGSPSDTLDRFRSRRTATTHPPGPLEDMLGECIVHGEDIRRPLGITHDYPVETVTRVADFYKRSNLLLGAKRRIAGLTLRATDANWSTGTGPEVAGPALSLVLVMAGRTAGLSELSGPGLDTLRTRG